MKNTVVYIVLYSVTLGYVWLHRVTLGLFTKKNVDLLFRQSVFKGEGLRFGQMRFGLLETGLKNSDLGKPIYWPRPCMLHPSTSHPDSRRVGCFWHQPQPRLTVHACGATREWIPCT